MPPYGLNFNREPSGKGTSNLARLNALAKLPPIPAAPISYEAWCLYTLEGTEAPRSAKMVNVDNALKTYRTVSSPGNRKILCDALEALTVEKGFAWKDGLFGAAIEVLYKEIVPPLLNERANDALIYPKSEAERIVKDLFHNKKLDWRDTFFQNLKNNTWALQIPGFQRTLANLPTKLRQSGPVSLNLDPSRMLQDIIPPEIRNEVMDAIKGNIPKLLTVEFAKSMAPVVGTISEAASIVKDMKGFIQGEIRAHKTRTHLEQGLAKGTPEAAIKTMIGIIKAESHEEFIKASASVTAFCLKLISPGAGEVIVGAAKALFEFLSQVRILARDITERNDANALMSDAEVKIQQAFKACPILGAYYVCCVPHSVLVNKIFDTWGSGGLNVKVERALAEHALPLRELAQELIHKHRFVIKDLQNYPGLLDPNKTELARMQAGRVPMADPNQRIGL